jgi:F-type H+-transporting ATPase subunit b
MKISWFTVIAQLINFLILVWLMRRFLYKPVLAAIDGREKKIAGQLADAESKKADAAKEQADYKQKNELFEKNKKDLMDKAVAETNDERKKLMDAASADADNMRAKQKNSMKDMLEKLNHEIEQKIRKEVFAISRKTLTDIASASLEEQITTLFIKRLNELKDEERKKFVEACKTDKNPVLVQSAFELQPKQQTDIQNAITALLGAGIQFKFRTAPDIISGIELLVNGFKVGWSISAYLNSLEKTIADTINEQSESVPASNQEPEAKVEPEKKSETDETKELAKPSEPVK